MKKSVGKIMIKWDEKDGKILTKGYGYIAASIMESSISLGAKGLYAYLISIAGAKDFCFPSNAKIMNDLGIKSRNTLRDYKDELIVQKLLSVEERKLKSGRLTSNNYYPTKMYMNKE